MIITPHALMGLLIATGVERLRFKKIKFNKRWHLILLTGLLCFLSHFILDSIPHYDYSIYPDPLENIYKILIDVGIFTIIFWFIFRKQFASLIDLLNQPMSELHKTKNKDRFRHLPFFFMVVIGLLVALLPDILSMAVPSPDKIFLLGKIQNLHKSVHSNELMDILPGMYVQIFTSVFLIYCLLRYKKRLEFEGSSEEAEAWLANNLRE